MTNANKGRTHFIGRQQMQHTLETFKGWIDKKLDLNRISNSIVRGILRRYAVVVFMSFLVTIVIILKIAIMMIFERPMLQIPKDIKIELAQAIRKGCLFEDAKYIFDNEERIDANLLSNRNVAVFKPNTDMIDVLDEMIYDYYQRNGKDSFYIEQLYAFKKEAKEKYPFDKLKPTEKSLFEKLRADADTSYKTIESDVIAIADELNNKNEEIETYLAEAEASYILSIIAFFISLATFLPLLWRFFKKIFT